MDWHLMKSTEAVQKLDSRSHGLSDKEAAGRLDKYGYNSIELKNSFSPWKLFLSQFTDVLVVILIIAAIVSYGIGFLPGQTPDPTDSILILAIVLANGIFGFVQNYKAEKSIESLKKLSNPMAVVLRGGARKEIEAKYLVPGDVVIINEGDGIPADARLLSVINLSVDESTLTGESNPVSKNTEPLKGSVPISEKKNMVFSGTTATRGKATAMVVSTGMKTELGRIADLIHNTKERATPFQIELERIGKKIGYGILIIIAFISVFHFFFLGTGIKTVFLTAISLAVAAIPEGLPAVVTVSLALGMRSMLARNSLVRKMPVVESLGSVDVICTDKTGTLTKNEMTVTRLYYDDYDYEILEGKIFKGEQQVPPEKVKPLLKCGVLCNDAFFDGEKHVGDPTEIALLVSGKGISYTKRAWEIPFSSERKMMTVAVKENKAVVSYTKGAPEVILERCSHYLLDGKVRKMSGEMKARIHKKNEEMASNALRVLGFAYKEKSSEESAEKGMIFLGLQGMIDPPRREVKDAIALTKKAGISVVMITGDNKLTAKAVASEVGIDGNFLAGVEIDKLSDDELCEAVKSTSIFARVSPEHKVRILKALQKNGSMVAMTGDGVNDAPALKNSDVGIAMGVRGTDVAKQSSQLILLDDNFATIVAAIKEGRTIFDNIRKFVNYLLSSNFAEVFVVFFASLAGYLPVTAVQLLWLNLLTDGFPALALGADPAAPDVMEKKPRKGESVINSAMAKMVVIIGVVLTLSVLSVFFLSLGRGLVVAQTMAFTAFVVYEFMRILVIRQQEKLSIFSNKWLLVAVGVSLALQIMVIYTPLNVFFGTVPLGLEEWGFIAIFGILGYITSVIATNKLARKL